MQGLAEGGDVGLAATVDTVEQLWHKACNGRNVDDGAFLVGDEALNGRVGQSGQGGDVEADHFGHAFDITIQQAGVSSDTRIIHQQGDAGVITK